MPDMLIDRRGDIPDRRDNDYIPRQEFRDVVAQLNTNFLTVLEQITGLRLSIQHISDRQDGLLEQFNTHVTSENECKGRVTQLVEIATREEASRNTIWWVGRIITGVLVVAGLLVTIAYNIHSIATK